MKTFHYRKNIGFANAVILFLFTINPLISLESFIYISINILGSSKNFKVDNFVLFVSDKVFINSKLKTLVFAIKSFKLNTDPLPFNPSTTNF
jgi:ABC-type spermidine/putrescine transport system permease subunit I